MVGPTSERGIMVVAMIEWVNPAWGWGLTAAVALPVAAHLLSGHGGRLTAFPATRFVQRAAADTARIAQPRHRLLLLLRILLLAAVVLALMQPRWSAATPLAPGSGANVVLLIDRSASMQRTRGGATLFDDARRRAIDLLRTLDPASDTANVVLVDDAPRPLAPALTANIAWLIDQLETVTATNVRGDVTGALAVADAAFAVDRGRPARLVAFTDMQATQWREAVIPDSVAWVPQQILGPSDNVALHRPTTSPARLIVNQPAQASVHISNFRPEPKTLTVAMTHDHRVVRQSVAVEAYAVATAAFELTPAETGLTLIHFDLEHGGDALPFDDQVGVYVPVDRARPVALATADNADDPATAAYFLRRALLADDAGVALQLATPGVTAADPDAVVFAGAGRVELKELERLAGQGLTVVWCIDSPEAAASLGDDSATWVEGEPAGVAAVNLRSPPMRVFEGPAVQPLMNATFTRRVRGSLSLGIPLITLDDGMPLLAARAVADGWLITVTADLSPASTDFSKSPAFAPLLHQLIRGFAPRGTAGNPSPRSGDNRFAQPGPSPNPTDSEVPAWIELDERESDLRPIDLAAAGDEVGSLSSDGDDTARREVALWPLLVALALTCAMAEPWLVRTISGGMRDG